MPSKLQLPRLPNQEGQKAQPRCRSLALNTAWEDRFPDIGKGSCGGELLLQQAAENGAGASPTRAQKRQAEMATLHSANPELLERRKALSQAAFVKHSNSETVDSLRQTHGAQIKGTMSDSEGRDSRRSRKEKMMAMVDKVGMIPLALRNNMEAPDTLGSMNGIGHPLLNDPALMTNTTNVVFLRNPKGVLVSALANSQAALKGFQDHRSSHSSPQRLRPLNLGAEFSTPTLDAPSWGKSKSVSPIADDPSLKDPKDSLNLWHGKRLNRAEMKVEQRLHVLRNNPGAKKDLITRVRGFVDEKNSERAELEAQMGLLAERREQKTVEFVTQRLKSSKTIRQMADTASSAALFDPLTAQPRSDSNPLPESSIDEWSGIVLLGNKLYALRQHILAERTHQIVEAIRHEAVVAIQRRWKTHLLTKAFNRKKCAAVTIQKFVRTYILQNGKMKDAAAEIVLNFLEHMVYGGMQGLAGASVMATVKRAAQHRRTTQLVKVCRLNVLLRQWNEVEARCIELVKKRCQGAMVAGLSASEEVRLQGERAKKIEAQKRAIARGYDEDPEERIRRVVAEAVSACCVTDRLVSDDLEPVPQPVKAATILSYIQSKNTAYTSLLGLYWKARAAHMVFKRNAKLQLELMGNVEEVASSGEVKPVKRFGVEGRMYAALPSGTGDEAQVSALDAAMKPSMAVFPGLFAKTREAANPGAFPLYRMFATIQELKAIMQQGVEEMPHYYAYMSKGQLASYEAQITSNLKGRFFKTSSPFKTEDGADAKEVEQSWTLSLLMDRWNAECVPRIAACMKRRYHLHRTDMIEQISIGCWLPHIDLANKLMELREG